MPGVSVPRRVVTISTVSAVAGSLVRISGTSSLVSLGLPWYEGVRLMALFAAPKSCANIIFEQADPEKVQVAPLQESGPPRKSQDFGLAWVTKQESFMMLCYVDTIAIHLKINVFISSTGPLCELSCSIRCVPLLSCAAAVASRAQQYFSITKKGYTTQRFQTNVCTEAGCEETAHRCRQKGSSWLVQDDQGSKDSAP